MDDDGHDCGPDDRATDHGGPEHSKLNRDRAYPELLRSRKETADLIQFWGMELDTPGAEHSSLIMPHSHHEHEALYDLESRFSRRDAFPYDPTRHTEPKMLEALAYMREIALPPLVIANHPSRSASDHVSRVNEMSVTRTRGIVLEPFGSRACAQH